MAFNPAKPAHLTPQQFNLISTIEQDLARWQSDVPHAPIRFLSKSESDFLSHLRAKHPTKIVAPQVQLIRLVNVDVASLINEWKDSGSHPFNFPKLKSLIRHINLLSVDFVICNASGIPKLAIEVDGPEHTVDLNTIEQWVVDSSAVNNWDGKSLKEMPENVKGWYRDRIKRHAIESSGILFRRIENSQVSDPAFLVSLDLEINQYVV